MENNEELIVRIEQLEAKCRSLEERVGELEKRKLAGRPVHDNTWKNSYNNWVEYYVQGLPVDVIIEKSGISRRTFYRYKAYYNSVIKNSAKADNQ